MGYRLILRGSISIHALLTESDSKSKQKPLCYSGGVQPIREKHSIFIPLYLYFTIFLSFFKRFPSAKVPGFSCSLGVRVF